MEEQNRRLVISPSAKVVRLPLNKAQEYFANELRGAKKFGRCAGQYSEFIGPNHKLIMGSGAGRHSKFTPGNIILSSLGETSSICIRCGLRRDLIRAGIIYWDVLEVAKPCCDTDFGIRDDYEIKTLARERLLEWREVKSGPENESLGEVFYKSFLTISGVHVQQPTTLGQDVVEHSGNSQGFPELVPPPLLKNTAQALVINCNLPVPGSDVPIEEIIAWRQKRNDQRLEFREAIRDIESALANGNYTDLQKAINKFFSNLAEVKKTQEENMILRYVHTHHLAFAWPNWKDLSLNTLGFVEAQTPVQAILCLLKLMLSCIKIEENDLGKLTGCFRYVIEAQKDWGQQDHAKFTRER